MWLQWLNFIAFLLVTGYGMFLIGKVIYSRYTYVKLGKPSDFKKDLSERLRLTLVNTFGQKKLLKDRKSGIMHIVMFYGFIILQFGALDLIYKGLANGQHLPIPGYAAFTLVQEITTALIILAVAYATYRRYIEKLPRLKRGWKPSIVLFFIFFLMLSVLFSAGFEAVWLGHEASLYTPVSSVIAGAFGWMSEGAAAAAFYVGWWAHLLILLSFGIYVPQSKHFHLITAPINVFLKRLEPAGKLRTLNLEDEEAESFGVGKIEDFEQKQLIDLYACVECGRCTNMCPASGTGKTLSPMHLITKLRDHLTEKGAAVTSNSAWAPAFVFAGGSGAVATAGDETAAATAEKVDPMNASMIGDVITEEEIWACTTCRNCEDQCPVMNEHVDKIVDMRRYLVLTEGRIPAEAQRAMQNIERQGNPWGINRNDRVKWRDSLPEGLTAPTVKEVEEFDYLFFVGSMGSYDNRSMKITQSFVKILNEAGVKFAILGNEEKNSGDTARRLGNELLFQMLAQENIEIFAKYGVQKIVTACPHTYNTFKNEYPEFGLEAEVLHHTELIGELIRDGRIKPTKEIKERITYHDSCYLGRYNEVYETPREILRSIPGVEVIEMERNREDGLCCGAGGGMMWMEETQGKRVNIERTEQALAVNPTMISSACPYCLTMMSDGTKAKEADDRVQTMDIAEIVAASLS